MLLDPTSQIAVEANSVYLPYTKENLLRTWRSRLFTMMFTLSFLLLNHDLELMLELVHVRKNSNKFSSSLT